MTSSPTAAPGWTLALAGVASFTVALDALVTAAALTSIQHDFEASLVDLQWVTNAYNLSFAVLLSVGAALGDRFGRKRIFVVGIMVFALASVACAMANSVTMLVVARILQGAGAALVTPVALALLSVAYPAEKRGKALGIFGSITGLAPLCGPALGGAISETLHWSAIFWINIPIALVLTPLALTKLVESHGQNLKVDGLGILLIATFSFAAIWGLMRGTEIGWTQIEVVAVLGAALVLAVAFVLWQRRATNALIPPRLFASKGFSAALVAAFCLYGSLYATLFFIIQFEQVAQGFGSLEAGLRILPWTATLFVIGPIAGSLVNRIGERALGMAGLVLNALGLLWLWQQLTPEISFMALAPALVVMGVGVSLAMPAVQSAALRGAVVADLGKASGAFSISRFLGGAFGVAAAATVFAAVGSFGSEAQFTEGFRAVLLLLAGATCVGALAAGRLPPRAPGLIPARQQS